MPDRLPTVWEIDPHTRAKHFILGRYLGGWFPILSKHHGRIVTAISRELIGFVWALGRQIEKQLDAA